MAEWVESLVKTRFLVASLGETATPPWWRSQATSAVGQRMLERLFPRTVMAASLETASRAARIEHDTHLGRLGAYHLFRLPTADEAAILDFLRAPAGTEVLREVAGLAAADLKLAALERLAGARGSDGAQGPVHCGAAEDLRGADALARMCAAYLAGLQASTPVYPYLQEARP